ncbi:Latrophilin-like protein 1 [Aphelenchoides bicaudatus]|nr:Latrophilin-like protein 1 [Aphelenchoides bicaudatus]
MIPLNKAVRWKRPSTILPFLLLLAIQTNGYVTQSKVLEVCEGETARLECTGDSEQISVELANFGRFSITPCNPDYNNNLETNCLNNSTLLVLANKCNGLSSCEFVVMSKLFGDSCPGTSKYLEARYSCVYVTTTVAPLTNPPSTSDHVAPTDQKTNTDGVRYSVDDYPIKSENCAAVFYRNVQWTETPANQIASVQCPLGSRGHAQRMCLPSGQWVVETDLSGCVSSSFTNLQEEFQRIWNTGFMVNVELLEDLRRLVRTEKLLSGDLVQLSELLYQVAIHSEKFTSVYNRRPLNEIATHSLCILNDLLQIGQRDAWIDLLPDKQTQVANRLLKAIQQTLQNVARSIASDKTETEMFVERPSVLGVVAVSKSQNTIELPTSSSYEIEDRVLFSLPNADIMREYEIVYSSIAADLGQFLMHQKANKHSDGCERQLMSKVLSAWAQVRSIEPKEEKIPVVLAFSTRKPKSSLSVQCAKWSEEQSDFVEDGSCMVLVHNSTQTICRCIGSGHYAVIGSTCDVQLFFGFNKETIALYVSSILVIVGVLIYLLGLSLIDQNQPEYVFIRRNFCTALIVAQLLLCFWFLLPRHGVWSSILLYFLHGTIFSVVCWLLVQMFQLVYSLFQIINQRNMGAHFLHYLVGYLIPAVWIIVLIAFSGNVSLFLSGFQPLQKPADLFVTGPLVLLLFVHFAFATLAIYLLAKRFRVGYMPCQRDAETLSAVRSSLIHLAPFILAIDFFCFMVVQFSLHPVAVWLWFIVGANIAQTALTLRVLSLKHLCSGNFFYSGKKNLSASNLPKNPIFSPEVQNNVPSYNFSFNEPAYVKHPIGHFMGSQQQIYVPSNGIHMPHDCHCDYATIPVPPEYYSFYNNQNYRVYHQNPANPCQLQRSIPHLPPVPPLPPNGFVRLNSENPIGFHPQGMHDESSSPTCHEHGSHCASLAALRLSNSQLYHQQSQLPRPPSDGSYETARSSSTGTTSASSGTFLLRMDPKQNPPIFP